MNILLTAATAKEIEPFFDRYRKSKDWNDIDVLITGIGLTATTYHLLKQVSIKKPGLIIQAGVAGSFDKKLSNGAVVAITKDVAADEGVIEEEQFKTVFDLGLLQKNKFPYKNGWLPNDSEIMGKINLKKVAAISVNNISASDQTISFYREKFNPSVESMEGAALHYVAIMEKIPFIQLRAVSNDIGERDKKKWKMQEAIGNLNDELGKLIQSLVNSR
jgi:futalosine hydrolase